MPIRRWRYPTVAPRRDTRPGTQRGLSSCSGTVSGIANTSRALSASHQAFDEQGTTWSTAVLWREAVLTTKRAVKTPSVAGAAEGSIALLARETVYNRPEVELPSH